MRGEIVIGEDAAPADSCRSRRTTERVTVTMRPPLDGGVLPRAARRGRALSLILLSSS